MKLLQKLKDWLIKRLGGYTRKEYNLVYDAYQIAFRRPRRSPVKLRACQVVSVEEFAAVRSEQELEARVCEKIVSDLQFAALPYVRFRKTVEDRGATVRIEGTLEVLEPQEG